MDKMIKMRKKVPIEEIDYPFLMNMLKGYRFPRNKINSLLRNGIIIRVKKGLYVFGKDFSMTPYSRETLANLIYGPSCISLDYALFHYGLIPERVEVITSVTPNRNKFFKTPVGNFSYRYIKNDKYYTGITLHQQDELHYILMATKEKAIIDKLYFFSRLDTLKDLKKYLYEDLRIESTDIKQLDIIGIKNIGLHYYSHNVNLLIKHLMEES